MELRTTFKVDPSPFRIIYDDSILFIGSCFASSIGARMESGKMKVMINPSGTVYNPVSVCNTLDIITAEREFSHDDLYFNDGNWLSFYHYTDFSSEDPDKVLTKINTRMKEASGFLKKAKFLFITLGTARVYRWLKTGLVVSNCHKIPSGQFSSELLPVDEIVTLFTNQLDKLNQLYPQLKVVFTISPVRHMKDGAHGNQVSKSVLFLAVEKLLQHSSHPRYFPAYELVMDDLRDYRFYSDDMLHPSGAAISYVWNAFAESYFDNDTLKHFNDAVRITKACSHRFNTDNSSKKKIFAEMMLKQVSEIEKRVPSIDFSVERTYFCNLLNE
jgi:hypothetical protein